MTGSILIEACVDSVESAIAAAAAGADRVELCGHLDTGGCTPSVGLIREVCRQMAIPVFVMIRPRGGDFCYSDAEFAVMLHDIDAARQAGAAAIVSGMLTPAGDIDLARASAVIKRAESLPVTFHRAFDFVRDPLASLEQLIELRFARILTSGLQASAMEGIDLLRTLRTQARDRIVILAGGGIREHNVGEIVLRTGVREIHINATGTTDGPMQFRNTRIALSAPVTSPTSAFTTGSQRSERIIACRQRLQAIDCGGQ